MLWQGARPTLKPAHSLKVFFVLDETTAGKGSGLSNRQLDKGCKAKAGSSRPRANSIARAHRIRSASGKQPRRNVQAEKSTLDDAVCSHYDSYIGTCFVFLTFLRCILFCFLPAQRWEAQRPCECCNTGFPVLDEALGRGIVPRDPCSALLGRVLIFFVIKSSRVALMSCCPYEAWRLHNAAAIDGIACACRCYTRGGVHNAAAFA